MSETVTRRLWPPDFRHAPTSWLRCASCGTPQRIRDMDQVAATRWVCSEDAGSPLCHRLRVEVGVTRAGPPTSSTTQP
jgi:hypothetical protein